MERLKPCPFCGGEARILTHLTEDKSTIGCFRCSVTNGWFRTGEEAVEKWNNRPSPWHTGTPTEEGWYLLCFPRRNEVAEHYEVAKFDGRDFVFATGMHQVVVSTSPLSVAWQKITPYKEN